MGETHSVTATYKYKHCGKRSPDSNECNTCKELIRNGDTFVCRCRMKGCRFEGKWDQFNAHIKICEFNRFPCNNPHDCFNCHGDDV